MKLFVSLAGIVFAAAGAAHAACSYPRSPQSLPDGNTASKEDMVAAQKAVKQYDADINAYIACLKLEHEQSVARDGASLTEEQKKDLERRQVQKHNAAIDELEAVAARFNEQVKVFNAKNKNKD
jgi:hypothetical protein